MKILHSQELSYAPRPNLGTWRTAEALPLDEENITSCFGLIKHQDSLIFINHISRGAEIPGGHREKGESVLDCFNREILEECGVKNLKNTRLQAIQEINISAPMPENYNYPYPRSYQALFYAEADILESFTANLDSLDRVLVPLSNIRAHEVYKKYHYLLDLVLE